MAAEQQTFAQGELVALAHALHDRAGIEIVERCQALGPEGDAAVGIGYVAPQGLVVPWPRAF